MARAEKDVPEELWRLRVLDGPDQGKIFELQPGIWSLGRSTDCSIALDAADKLLSRRHAELRIDEQGVLLTDLGSGNGTWLHDEQIDSALLRSDDVFRLGSNVLALECGSDLLADTTIYSKAPAAKAKARSSPRLRVLLLSACLLGLIAIIFITALRPKSGSDATDQKQAEAEAPAAPAETPAAPAEAPESPDPSTPGTDTAPPLSAQPPPRAGSEELPAAPQAKAKAETAFQQGMFFYKAGQLRQAVDEWSQASALDPENEGMNKWLLRAESELDQEIDKHFRQALLAVKYMRYDEARNEFRLVIEWARGPDDERYRTAQANLKELEGK